MADAGSRGAPRARGAAPPDLPLPSLADRKRADLTIKLDSLDRELRDWTARSKASGPLEKHHTQIRRLATILGALSTLAKADLAEAVKNGRVLDDARDLERLILEAHRSWDFFRSKLVLRDVELFRPALRAADALAWACYGPVREAAGQAAPKEPPLVFLNGGSNPFVLPRGREFVAESTLLGEGIDNTAVEAVLLALPIPVIGVPWFQVDHAPDMLVLGHEIGHAAEDDFALTARMGELLAASGIPPERQAAWSSWLGEVFADVYGAVALGPAFARALADVLAEAPAVIVAEQRAAPDWELYPTTALRVRVVTETLATRFPDDAKATWKAWTDLYPTHAMSAFEPDAERIAKALADGVYPSLGGKSLRALVGFTLADQKAAVLNANLLLSGQDPEAKDPRVLFAAARIAFEKSPVKYAERKGTPALFEHIVKVEKSGVRNTSAAAAGASTTARRKSLEAANAPNAPNVANVADTADAELGERLFEVFRAAGKRRAPGEVA